jgi:aminodeoxyfutalosine deaminase
VVLSTDDPDMFETSLIGEYRQAHSLGLSVSELEKLVSSSFAYSFLPAEERKPPASSV